MEWEDLSSGNIATLSDADDDTKVQVEEGNDDDVIRFDMGGTEYFQMLRGRIRFLNSGSSIFLGSLAGNNDDYSSNENVFIGNEAGEDNVTSIANVGIGRHALNTHLTGDLNTSIGNYSMARHITGGNNTVIGGYANNLSSDGAGNTIIGTDAMRSSTSGNNNVVLGYGALYNTELTDNTVAIGYNSGFNARGSRNVFIGSNSGQEETESNRLYIENSASLSPLIYGEFDNDLARINGDLYATGNSYTTGNAYITGDVGIGEASPQGSLDVVDNAVIGNVSIGSESTDQGTSIHAGDGFTTTPWLYTNAVEAQGERGAASTLITIGNDGTHGGDDRIHFVTSGVSQMMIASNGRIGIDQGSPSADLHIRQSQQNIIGGTGGILFEDSDEPADTWRIYHSGIFFSFNHAGERVSYIDVNTGAWVTTSDRSFKKNVNGLSPVLDKIMKLRPVDYHYKRQNSSQEKVLGFIAQEVKPLFPEMVSEGEDGTLGISYGSLGPIAIKAIQEQQIIIKTQKEKIDQLQIENDEFKKRFERIEKVLNL